jgi:integrase
MLTDVKIKSLKPKEKSYKVSDGHGLYLEVYPTGSKLWRVKYRSGGKETRRSLGPWPLVSIKAARDLSDKGRFERRTGTAPAEDAPPSPTVAELCGEWRPRFTSGLAPSTVAGLTRLFDKHIIPSLGQINVGDLTSEMVLKRLLRPLEASGHLTLAHNAKATLGRVLRFAMAGGLVDRDATHPLTGALAPHQTRHRATIVEPGRIGKLMVDIGSYTGGPVVGTALRMLPYVFVRPGELRHAEWAEFDLDERLWRIPAGRMKMRSAHLVPLSTQVVELLERLRPVTGGGRYLFPGHGVKDRPMSRESVTFALRSLGYGRNEICPHGFRAMASTLLNERGCNSDWIERQLAHVERSGVRAAYNHADWLPERRKMMQEWADLLDSLAAAAAKG